MPKLLRGRFVGRTRGESGPRGIGEPSWEQIPRLPLEQLCAIVDQYEARHKRDAQTDHPAWLGGRSASWGGEGHRAM